MSILMVQSTLETLPTWLGVWEEAGTASGDDGVLVSLGTVPGDHSGRAETCRREQHGELATGLMLAARPASRVATSRWHSEQPRSRLIGSATVRTDHIEYAPLPAAWNAVMSTDLSRSAR